MQRDLKRRLFVVALIFSLSILTACKSKNSIEQGTPITITRSTTKSYVETETATGTLYSLHNVTVSAETTGRVLSVPVDVGQAVKPQQLLLEINPIEQKQGMDAKINNVKAFEAGLVYENKLLQRYGELVTKGAIPQTTYDQTKAIRDGVEAKLEEAKIQLANSEYQVAKTQVVSPISGLIKQRLALPGDFVAAGAPLFEIVDISNLRAKLNFPETVHDELAPGLPVTLTSIASPGESISGKITAISPMVDPVNRAIEVIIDFTNTSNWPPGASVKGIVEIKTEPNVVMVPNESIVQRPRGFVVYVIRDHLAAEQLVEIGPEQNGWTVIRKGITTNTSIAVDGAAYLSDKTPVIYAQEKS